MKSQNSKLFHPRGTISLRTKRLLLRRYVPEDASVLHREFGTDEKMFEFSGWNPYETLKMARETVDRFLSDYTDERFYGWAIEAGGRLVGTIGAYDYDPIADSVEVGLSIARDSWGKGFAAEALARVLAYLTEEEGIGTVKAWCAAENIGSMKAMEKAGMVRIGEEPEALDVGGKKYDKLNYTFSNNN